MRGDHVAENLKDEVNHIALFLGVTSLLIVIVLFSINFKSRELERRILLLEAEKHWHVDANIQSK